jgi:hypothetical protein
MNSMNNSLASMSVAFALMYSVPTFAAPTASGSAIAAAADTLSIVESVGWQPGSNLASRCGRGTLAETERCHVLKRLEGGTITNVHTNRPSVNLPHAPIAGTKVPRSPIH